MIGRTVVVHTSGWEIATAVGTIGAAVAAACAAIVSARSGKATAELVRLESERRDDERAASGVAALRAAFREHTYTEVSHGEARSESRQWLQVWNEGPAVAERLVIHTTGSDGFEIAPSRGGVPNELHAGQRVDFPVRQSKNYPRGRVEIEWRDARGTNSMPVVHAWIHTTGT